MNSRSRKRCQPRFRVMQNRISEIAKIAQGSIPCECMAAESEVQLEIGHVLFMDVVGYSKLLVDEQREIQEQLNQIVRSTQQVAAAGGAGKLIRLPTGDGMALVFFNSPEAPVYCAIDVAKKVKEHPKLKLRMGIHSGPVNEVRDVNDRISVAGTGINTAQRVMDCGDAGHILVSKHAAEDLAQSRQWRPYLHDLGVYTAKYGAPVHVVNFYAGDFGNPQLPDKFKHGRRTRILMPGTATKLWASIAAALTAAAAFALIVSFFFHRPSSKSTSAAVSTSLPALISEKSIAVLPFENRSDEKQNARGVEHPEVTPGCLTDRARDQICRGIMALSSSSIPPRFFFQRQSLEEDGFCLFL